MTYHLIQGNPMEPSSTDIIAHECNLSIDELPPGALDKFKKFDPHCGWRILTGNSQYNLWGRIAYRYEIEEDNP